MSFWADLQQAFDEGRDEVRLGAPPDRLIDAMTLAAGVDRHITQDELHRMVGLLKRHFRAFANSTDGQIMNALSDSVMRLRAEGDDVAQTKALAQSIKAHGVEGAETAYGLAFAVLVENGLSEDERAFADAFQVVLEIDGARAEIIESELLAVLKPAGSYR